VWIIVGEATRPTHGTLTMRDPELEAMRRPLRLYEGFMKPTLLREPEAEDGSTSETEAWRDAGAGLAFLSHRVDGLCKTSEVGSH
jgi:hypothetical protein